MKFNQMISRGDARRGRIANTITLNANQYDIASRETSGRFEAAIELSYPFKPIPTSEPVLSLGKLGNRYPGHTGRYYLSMV
jgi:hypothetical protein